MTKDSTTTGSTATTGSPPITSTRKKGHQHNNSNSKSPYDEVATFINKLILRQDDNNASNKNNIKIQSVVYSKDGQLLCSSTRTYALVCKVWGERHTLSELELVLSSANSSSSTKNNDKNSISVINNKIDVQNLGLLWTLLYELLLGGNQSIIGGGSLKRMIISNEKSLRQTLLSLKSSIANNGNYKTKMKSNSTPDNQMQNFPRYVRINTFGQSDCISFVKSTVKTIHDRIEQIGLNHEKQRKQRNRLTETNQLNKNDKKRKYNTTSTLDENDIIDTTDCTTISTNSPLIAADQHVPYLIVVPRSLTKALLATTDYNSGNITQSKITTSDYVLQDKSSCFSALCLVGDHTYYSHSTPGSNSSKTLSSPLQQLQQGLVYVDACAAPGNKTTHLAALLWDKYNNSINHTSTSNTTNNNNNINIIAFDRNEQRCNLLRRRVDDLLVKQQTSSNAVSKTTHGLVQVDVRHQDFLSTTIKDLLPDNTGRIDGILLDPSCSGSGIVTDVDRQNDDTNSTSIDQKQRLEKISNFQIVALKHSMSLQPKRIVYSTCSIHMEENEHVIASVLSSTIDTTTTTTTTTTTRQMESNTNISAKNTKSKKKKYNKTAFEESNMVSADATETAPTTVSYRSKWEVIAPPICLSNWTRRGVSCEYFTSLNSDGTEVHNTTKTNENKEPKNDTIGIDNVETITTTKEQQHRSYITPEEASCMIRVDPFQGDDTNGFFVCILQRKDDTQENQQDENELFDKSSSSSTTSSSIIVQDTFINRRLGLPTYEKGMFTIDTSKDNERTQSKAKKGVNKIVSANEKSKELMPSSTNKEAHKNDTKETGTVKSDIDKHQTQQSKESTSTSTSTSLSHSTKQAKKMKWKLKQYKKKRQRIEKTTTKTNDSVVNNTDSQK